MKFYSYVIPRDYGFAPNPYFDYCTLATCKPRIRKSAQIGDWVAAFGAANTPLCGRLVFMMRVEEILTYDDYWEDERFKCKRPVFNRGVMHMYGDNIYHHVENNEWMQEPSHHSLQDGSINYDNLVRDTQTDRVLIAREFFYFGNNAILIPNKYAALVGHGRNHMVCLNQELIIDFINYIHNNYTDQIYGIPYSRKPGRFAHYRGERR